LQSFFITDSVWLPSYILPEVNDVWIRVVSQVKAAKEVTVEALSNRDWALIQQYSEWLENGGFLQQVSLVYNNQEIAVHLPDDSVVWVRTVRLDKEHDTSKMIWPDDDTDDDGKYDEDHSHESWYRRILADTELVLLPAPTENGDDDATVTAFRLQPALEEYSLSMQQLYGKLGELPGLVPCSHGTIVLHPRNWYAENQYGNISMVGESADGFLKTYNVRVDVSEHVEDDCIGKFM